MPSKLSIEEVKKTAERKDGEFLSEVYKNSKTNHWWRCRYGHEWTATAGNIRAGHWCPHCEIERKRKSWKPQKGMEHSKTAAFSITREELEERCKTMFGREIAEIYGCSQAMVDSYRRKWNIPSVTEYRRAKDGYKICSKCKMKKKVGEFHIHREKPDGHFSQCKICRSKYSMEYRSNLPRDKVCRKWARGTLASHRRRGKNVEDVLDVDWLSAFAEKTFECPLCGSKLMWEPRSGITWRDPTLDRKSNEQNMNRDNVWIICRRCNTTKGDGTVEDILAYCRSVVKLWGVEG